MAEFLGALLALLIICALDTDTRPKGNSNVTKGDPTRTATAPKRGPRWRVRRDPLDKNRAELIAPNGAVAMTGTYAEMSTQAKLRNAL